MEVPVLAIAPLARGSGDVGFAQRQTTSRTEGVALLLLSGVTSAVLLGTSRTGGTAGGRWQEPPLSGAPRQLLYLAALLLLLNTCLYRLLLAPSSWRCWRVAVLSAVRLALLPGVLLVAAAYYQLLTRGHGRGSGSNYTLVVWVHLLLVLSVGSGALMLGLVGGGCCCSGCSSYTDAGAAPKLSMSVLLPVLHLRHSLL
jgi:hypothetical protein